MYRYTTQDLIFSLPIESDLISEAYVTIKQLDLVIERSMSQMTKDGKNLKLHLTQEETGQFKAKKSCKVQLRLRDINDNAYASEEFKLEVKDVIKEGVI